MWLPKDERLVLKMLYKKCPGPGKEDHFPETELSHLLEPSKKTEGGGSDNNDDDGVDYKKLAQDVESIIKNMENAKIICSRLKERQLIEYNEYLAPGNYSKCSLKLSIDGWDLGHKYSTWWGTIHLWWKEHFNHPVILGIAYLLGAITTVVLQWIFSS
ncbi:MAG: hypothetical protein KAR11_00695 [Phycisphaerae bacterium]|nr:hypothetical protein [Phycisphaerae bacterium]